MLRSRRLARRRTRWTLSRLGRFGLGTSIRLLYRRTIGLRPSLRLCRGWPIGFWTVIGLGRITGSGPIRAADIILRTGGRRIGGWLGRGVIRSVVWRSRCFGVYNGAIAECTGLRSGSDGWRSMICGGALRRIRTGLLLVLRLSGYRRNVSLMRYRFLLSGGACADPTLAAVVADAVGRVVDHRRVVDIVNIGDIHVAH